MFGNINRERFDLFNQSGGLNSLKSCNKFNIMDYAPIKEDEGDESHRTKKKMIKKQSEAMDDMTEEIERIRAEEARKIEEQR